MVTLPHSSATISSCAGSVSYPPLPRIAPVRTTTAGSSALGDSGTGIDDPSKLTYPSFSSALCCKPFARLTAVFQPLLSHRDQIPIPVLPVRLHFSHSVHPYSNGFRVFFSISGFFPTLVYVGLSVSIRLNLIIQYGELPRGKMIGVAFFAS